MVCAVTHISILSLIWPWSLWICEGEGEAGLLFRYS